MQFSLAYPASAGLALFVVSAGVMCGEDVTQQPHWATFMFRGGLSSFS